MNFPTLQDLLQDETISEHFSRFSGTWRPVDWRGDGVYSLDADGVYRPDDFPSASKVYLSGEPQ